MSAIVQLTKSETALLGLGYVGILNLGTNTIIVGDLQIDINFIAKDFSVRRAPEGPQIIISWTAPPGFGGIYEVRLERNAWSYPEKLYDGESIFHQSVTGDQQISDRSELIHGQGYYYTLFIKDPDTDIWYTHSSMQGSSIAFNTGYFKDKLFNLLPRIYRTMDARPDLGGLFGQVALKQTTPSTGNFKNITFNFEEDQFLKQGQLQRFLKLLGLNFDEIRYLTEQLIRGFDIDSIEGKFLQYLASKVGLDLNKELSLGKQRKELRNYIHFHRYKGTEEAFRSQVNSITENGSIFVVNPRDSLLFVSKITKEFGEMQHGRDLVGPLIKDLVGTGVETGSADVSDRVTTPETPRPHSLFFNNGYGPKKSSGYFIFLFDGVEPVTQGTSPSFGRSHRWKIVEDGAYTVESWISILRFPYFTVTDVPTSYKKYSDLFDCIINTAGGLNKKAYYYFGVVTEIDASTGVVKRYLSVNQGTYSSITNSTNELFRVSLDDENFKINKPFHIALTKKIKKGPGMVDGFSKTHVPSYNNLNPSNLAEFSLYLNGTKVATRESYWLDSTTKPFVAQIAKPSVGEIFFDGFFVGMVGSSSLDPAETGDSYGVAWVMDEYRVWNRPRTEDEISENYQLPVNSYEENLILYAPYTSKHTLIPAFGAFAPSVKQIKDLSFPASKIMYNGQYTNWDALTNNEGVLFYQFLFGSDSMLISDTGDPNFGLTIDIYSGPPKHVNSLMPNPFDTTYLFDDEMRRREVTTFIKEAYTLSQELHPHKVYFDVHTRPLLPLNSYEE